MYGIVDSKTNLYLGTEAGLASFESEDVAVAAADLVGTDLGFEPGRLVAKLLASGKYKAVSQVQPAGTDESAETLLDQLQKMDGGCSSLQ